MEFAYQPVVGEARSVSGSGVERFEARATFNLEIITAGMNVWVDAFTIANVNVYVGSGLGVGFAEFDSKDVETAGFAQLGGGLQYLLNDRTWLDFGYRYQVSEPFFDSVRFDGHISRLGIGVAF